MQNQANTLPMGWLGLDTQYLHNSIKTHLSMWHPLMCYLQLGMRYVPGSSDQSGSADGLSWPWDSRFQTIDLPMAAAVAELRATASRSLARRSQNLDSRSPWSTQGRSERSCSFPKTWSCADWRMAALASEWSLNHPCTMQTWKFNHACLAQPCVIEADPIPIGPHGE